MKLLTITIPSYNTEQFIEKNMKYFLENFASLALYCYLCKTHLTIQRAL